AQVQWRASSRPRAAPPRGAGRRARLHQGARPPGLPRRRGAGGIGAGRRRHARERDADARPAELRRHLQRPGLVLRVAHHAAVRLQSAAAERPAGAPRPLQSRGHGDAGPPHGAGAGCLHFAIRAGNADTRPEPQLLQRAVRQHRHGGRGGGAGRPDGEPAEL
ncbi:MAG: Outer membrane lipoprotein OmlA, partial [uncultured Sphingomonadaceae bacterium]